MLQQVIKSSLHRDEKFNLCQKWLQTTFISSVNCTQNWKLPGVLSMMPKTFWWHQMSTQCGNELMKQVLLSVIHIMKPLQNQCHVQSQNTYCRSCSFKS